MNIFADVGIDQRLQEVTRLKKLAEPGKLEGIEKDTADIESGKESVLNVAGLSIPPDPTSDEDEEDIPE